MASQPIDERHTIWQQFLNKWTPQVLASMTLPQYHIANDTSRDNLVNWLEVRTQKLGSIWGGSAFKFGVFNRAERSHKVSGGGLSYTTEYGWYTKYGATPDEAFVTVRNLILEIVTAAQKSDIDAIERISFSPAIKWKLAFLYQPQDKPFMPAIYASTMLKSIMGIAKTLPLSQMYKRLMEQRKGQEILLFTDALLEKINGTGPRAEATVRQAGIIDTAIPLNRIFYGPPGTGKTWHTIKAALEILDSDAAELDVRKELKARFDALVQEKRVRFVTFHQSFSYEDFVEGIRPETSEGDDGNKGITYTVKPGIFKEMCEAAQARTVYAEDASVDLAGRNVWKMSLGNSRGDTAYIYEECLKTSRLLMGYGDLIDFNSCQTYEAIRQKLKAEGFSDAEQNGYTCTALNTFLLQMRKGDLVIVTEGLTKFRAIAEIIGDYEAVDRSAEGDSYGQGRRVRWLRQFAPSLDADKLLERQFSQMTLYRLNLSAAEKSNLENLLAPAVKDSGPEPHVLIIDEINRGNIAGIFGELITLIEPSKRLGSADEIRVRLPYSRESFGVPDNLYIIGTMNTADRSLTGLDIALRRRFTFKEMCPDPTLLKDKMLQGTNISVGDMLAAMNQRIEVLLDRDHCIGHASFMSLGDTVTAQELAAVFEGSILPLLQEYFFEDWGKIRRVLNDHNKEKGFCFIEEKNIVADILEQDELQRSVWQICHDAFDKMESYTGIVRAPAEAAQAQSHANEGGSPRVSS